MEAVRPITLQQFLNVREYPHFQNLVEYGVVCSAEVVFQPPPQTCVFVRTLIQLWSADVADRCDLTDDYSLLCLASPTKFPDQIYSPILGLFLKTYSL